MHGLLPSPSLIIASCNNVWYVIMTKVIMYCALKSTTCI